jgi:molecular chaperone GrpE (heat shock protein)
MSPEEPTPDSSPKLSAPSAPPKLSSGPPPAPPPAAEGRPMASSSLYRMAEELIALRETNKHQHRLFEKSLKEAREDLGAKFNSFAADTQRAYQQLRQEVHGEKRVSLNLLNEMLEICTDLRQVVSAKPKVDDVEAVAKWIEAVEVQSRKVQDAVERHGIVAYDAVIATPYNPAIHERVGSMKKDGMGPLLIAEQRECGWASQQPEFVLRRPKVIVSE